jgi:hypothetical protein
MRGRTDGLLRLLATTVLAAAIPLPATAGKIYWTQEGTILRADLDGANIETVLDGIDPIGIAFGGGKLYWGDDTADDILRGDGDGSNVETVVDGAHAHVIALDLTQNKIYWSPGGSVRRANLDGSEVETIIEDNYYSINGIALDTAAGKIYFSDLPSGVYEADLDGANVEHVSTTCCPAGLALDPQDQKLYIANIDYVLTWIHLGGGGSGIFSNDYSSALGIDLEARYLYWSDPYDDSGIWRKGLDAVNQENVLPNQRRAAAQIAIDSEGADAVPAISVPGIVAAAAVLLAASAAVRRRRR